MQCTEFQRLLGLMSDFYCGLFGQEEEAALPQATVSRDPCQKDLGIHPIYVISLGILLSGYYNRIIEDTVFITTRDAVGTYLLNLCAHCCTVSDSI